MTLWEIAWADRRKQDIMRESAEQIVNGQRFDPRSRQFERKRQRVAEAYDSADFVAKEIRERAREASQIDLSSAFVDKSDPQQVNAMLEEALRSDPASEVFGK